jgi:hypothetical protein
LPANRLPEDKALGRMERRPSRAEIIWARLKARTKSSSGLKGWRQADWPPPSAASPFPRPPIHYASKTFPHPVHSADRQHLSESISRRHRPATRAAACFQSDTQPSCSCGGDSSSAPSAGRRANVALAGAALSSGKHRNNHPEPRFARIASLRPAARSLTPSAIWQDY